MAESPHLDRTGLAPDAARVSLTLSPLAKYLLIASGGVVVGIFLGVAITRILDEVHSDAPHLPTLLHEVAEVAEVDVTEVDTETTESLHAVAKELGIDLEEK